MRQDAQIMALAQQRSVTAELKAQRSSAITRLAAAGLPLTLIAQRVGCTKSMVARTCEAAGVALARKIDYSQPVPTSRPGLERTPAYLGRSEAGQA